MKKEYDFTCAETGKFYQAGADINLPIYLDPDIKEHFEKLAKKKNVRLGTLINQILKDRILADKSLSL
jgi:hypothetical protein